MTRWKITMVTMALLATMALRAEKTQALAVPKIAPPKLDGTLDDPAWQQATKIPSLYPLDSDKPSGDTTVYLGRDDAWLYFGFRCDNPNMSQVDQRAGARDSQLVFGDESIELFIRPEKTKNRYYNFVLNFANVGVDRRIDENGVKEFSWNAPWRNATQRSKDGWTAEIAVPLFALKSDDLSGASLNIGRNFIDVALDPYGAKQSETKKCFALKRGNSGGTGDSRNFLPLVGLSDAKPEVPFVPTVDSATIIGYREENGKLFYEVAATVKTASPISGEVKVKLIETRGGESVEKCSETVVLRDVKTLTLRAPTEDFLDRKVSVALIDTKNGNALDSKILEDTATLSVIKKAFVGQDYYTTEPTAKIRMEFGLPETIARNATLVLAANGSTAAKIQGVTPVMTPEIPTNALKIGDNVLKIAVVAGDKELATKTLNVKRLAPRPGFEVKTDFIKGVILKNDKPIFPVMMYTNKLREDNPELADKILGFLSREIGFNGVLNSGYGAVGKFLALAEKHDLDVITWNSPQPLPIGMKPGTWPPPPVTKSLKERLAYQKKWYVDSQETKVIADTKESLPFRNCLGYYNVDEPNLVNPDERIAVAEWYWNTVTQIDPYRPICLLYSAYIPPGDTWTNWGQLLGYDIYPKLYRPDAGVRIEPGLCTAYYLWQLRERCRQDNKVMFLVPISNIQDPARTPVGMDKTRMLCQAYVGLIYGAKCFMYFSLNNVCGQEAWDALKTINTQVKTMAPALLNDVEQNIIYPPNTFRPEEQKFPMVNAAAFQYPDGDYLLLAANIRPFAVETTFAIENAKSIEKLFVPRENAMAWWDVFGFSDGDAISLREGAFAEKIEPYGVRAYKFKLGHPGPVRIALNMTAIENEKAPSVDLPAILRGLALGKNKCPNPCFKQQTIKKFPDFYRPHFCESLDLDAGKKGSSWYIDEATTWNGNPSLCMRKDIPEKSRGAFGVCYPPVSDKPIKMTFSFYAKGGKPGDSVTVNLKYGRVGDKRETFPLTAEWKRYAIAFDLLPGGKSNMGGRVLLIMPGDGATVWVSGLQLEKGEAPTEFQDSSITE